jgi:molybdate transport system permease protein
MEPLLSPQEWDAARTSLIVAGRAILIAAPIALGLAALLARPRLPGRTLLDALVHAPLVVPPVVVGFFLLLLFGVEGPVGRWLDAAFGVRLAFSSEGASLAAGVMALPLMVRAMRIAFEAQDPGLLEAARLLGAGPLDRFFSITLPLASPGIAAAVITGFAACLGEFGAVITFAANVPGETQTLPLALYGALQTPGGEARALRLAGLSLGLALAALIAAEALLTLSRRRTA